MRNGNLLKVGIIVSVFGIMSGCGSCGSAPAGNNSNSEANGTTKVIKPEAAANSNIQGTNSNANSPRLYPGLKDGKVPSMDNTKVKVIDTSKIKASPMVKKMPDNSEMSAIGKPDGSFVETRRFLNHPQLEKIERTIRTMKDITLKAYLRNGKVITIPTDKLKDYKTAPASNILKIAGVKLEVPATENRETKDGQQTKKPSVNGSVKN